MLKWFWLSFVDPTKPQGLRSLGIAVVEGYDFLGAIQRAWDLGINPGGEVAGYEVTEGDGLPAAEYRNRLVSPEECASSGIGIIGGPMPQEAEFKCHCCTGKMN